MYINFWYPAQEKYGIVFAFLGDLPASKRPPLYEIPEYDADDWRANQLIVFEKELLVPADRPIVRYREFLKDWEDRGWRIDLSRLRRLHGDVAFAIPCPRRRTGSAARRPAQQQGARQQLRVAPQGSPVAAAAAAAAGRRPTS